MNKKILILIFVVILLIILSLIIVLNKKDNKDIINDIPDTALSETIPITDITSKIENSSKSVDVIIPQFKNLESNFERYINDKLYEDLNENTIYKKATEGYEENEIGAFTYEVYYDRYNFGDYISIVANQYIHLGDGRPQATKKCYVINVRTNATVSLVDVFKDKINYKNKILEEINKQAEELDIELIGGNGLKSLSNTQEFYIKDGKLIIYFEASEVAATAVGELEFEMPFEMEDGYFIF